MTDASALAWTRQVSGVALLAWMALLLLILLALLLGRQWQASQQLAYSAYMGDNWDLFLADWPSGLTLNLTHTPTLNELAFAWDETGAQLFILSSGADQLPQCEMLVLADLRRTVLAPASTAQCIPDDVISIAWRDSLGTPEDFPIPAPDGSLIAILRPDVFTRRASLLLRQVETHRQFLVTHINLPDEVPRWSADSRSLAFTANRDGNVEVYVMTAPGFSVESRPTVRRLTYHSGPDLHPAWRPE